MKAHEFFDVIWDRFGLIFCKETSCSVDIWRDEPSPSSSAQLSYWIQIGQDDVIAVIPFDNEISIEDNNLVCEYDGNKFTFEFYARSPRLDLEETINRHELL